MGVSYKKEEFVVGDLVYYQGFEIFEPHKRYIGVVVGMPPDAYADHTYYVFWFDSRLTTRLYCDNITLVYEKWGLGLQFGNALLFINMNDTNSIPLRNIRYLIREALTQTDKAEVRRLVRKEFESEMKAKLSKAIEDEVAKVMKDKATKDQMGDIAKLLLKRLYKDLSYQHPYIIDRIKV